MKEANLESMDIHLRNYRYRLYNFNNTNFSTWIYCDTLLVKMDNVEEHDLVSDKDMYLFLDRYILILEQLK